MESGRVEEGGRGQENTILKGTSKMYGPYYWEFDLSLWKSSVKEFFPNKVTVSRSANNIQSNLLGFKQKLLFSEYLQMIAPKQTGLQKKL